MKTTLKQLLSRALHLLHVVDADEDVAPEELKRASFSLQVMLDSWSIERLTIPLRKLTKVQLFESKQSYFIGDGLDIDLGSAPMFINYVGYVGNGISRELLKGSDGEFSHFINERERYYYGDNIVNEPYKYFYQSEHSGNKLYLNSLPSAPFILNILSEHDFYDYIDYGCFQSEIELPHAYSRAIIYNLATEIAPTYKKEAPPTVQRIAQKSLKEIKKYNSKPLKRIYNHGHSIASNERSFISNEEIRVIDVVENNNETVSPVESESPSTGDETLQASFSASIAQDGQSLLLTSTSSGVDEGTEYRWTAYGYLETEEGLLFEPADYGDGQSFVVESEFIGDNEAFASLVIRDSNGNESGFLGRISSFDGVVFNIEEGGQYINRTAEWHENV